MPIIEVDVHRLYGTLASAIPAPADLKKAMKALGAAARAQWISIASDELKSTSRDYIQAISQPAIQDDGRTARIQLTGVVPNMVEQGWPATDLRETVLNGPHVKTSKDGYKYQSIPFRHGTPGTGKRNVGAPMPKPIHNVAKLLAPTMTGMGGLGSGKGQSILSPAGLVANRLTPGALSGGMGLGTVGQRTVTKVTKLLNAKSKEWHTTSIYTGMIRKVAAYGVNKAGAAVMQSSYMTFRTISNKPGSDPRSWMHPGIKARNIAKRVQTFIAETASKIIQDAVNE